MTRSSQSTIRPAWLEFSWTPGLGAVLAAALVAAAPAQADPPPPEQDWTRTEVRDDCTNYNPFRNPYFGDTHVHTKYSADAYLARTRNDPYDAYDYATGLTVDLPPYDATGREATIDRPLDFTAVTDHSEGFGELRICGDDSYAGYNDPLCEDLRDTQFNDYQPTNPLPLAFTEFFAALTFTDPMRFPGICGAAPGYDDCLGEAGLVWQDTQDAAEAYYDRTSACEFTTFIAYEWSGQTGGNNLHRNIIFRNDDVPSLPISYYEKWRAEDMRAELKAQCLDQPGDCDVLAIPHNSNLATDRMFSRYQTTGGLMTAEVAQLRADLEPIMELTQGKGDSECRDGVLGTTDELCRFENNPTGNILTGKLPDASDFSHLAYARGGLREGLLIERLVGVNPFSLGFIGSTDTHNALPGSVSEVDYGRTGQFGIADAAPDTVLADATLPSKIYQSGGGLSVVWAEENSRDAIFAAMRRRETYSTSGTRPILRVFGGRVPEDVCTNVNLDFVAEGYDKGVPMGGDIGPELGKKSPRFAILANMDPGTIEHPGTPLQRIQMVKNWIDPDDGQLFEEVYEVAGNPDNGATVDLDTCTEDPGTGGFETLCAVWTDPHFKADENAFYYVRVVENPVCRWHQRLCNDLKTCSVPLQACSLDLNRRCTSNADCEEHDVGSTCTETYTAICVDDSDCEAKGAGTCGATPAVDCSVPSSVPAAASECCDPDNSPTIQERAVASPIFYHPGRLGLLKGKIKFKDDPGSDRLLLKILIPDAPADLDPAVNDLVFTLRDDATAWTATIPAGTMEVKKAGKSYKYKDKAGTIEGITTLGVKISRGTAKITVKTGDIDLSTLTQESQKLDLDLDTGDYSSTAEREWDYKSSKLGTAR